MAMSLLKEISWRYAFLPFVTEGPKNRLMLEVFKEQGVADVMEEHSSDTCRTSFPGGFRPWGEGAPCDGYATAHSFSSAMPGSVLSYLLFPLAFFYSKI